MVSSGRPAPQHVAVVRMLRGLGDMLCAVPALRALKRALPKARVTLIGLPSAQGFVARFGHYLDELAECPGYPGLPEQPARVAHLPEFFAAMHVHKFDLAIQLHGNGVITNPFTVLLGARDNAGFFAPGHYCPDPERFLPYPEDQPEVLRHLMLMELLGVPRAGEMLEFPLCRNDRLALAALPEAKELWPKGYICIHPGAYDACRRWPADRFALVADALSDLGIPIILTGSAAERELTRTIAGAMRNKPIDLAGRTTLGALAALLSSARLLICNDTGVSHLADGLHVPSVIIFTNSDVHRWAPLDTDMHRVVAEPLSTNGGSLMENHETVCHESRFTESGMNAKPGPGPRVEQVLREAESLLVRERFPWRSQ